MSPFSPFKGCYCGSKRFLPGPRGAGSQNVTCVGCGAKFNLILATQLSPTVPPILLDEIGDPTGPPDLSNAHWLIEILDV